ncbi:unnamed protein product [Rotaria socialis]|uniref:Uncharacterized protein n=3 Tax=Rotaria socialis TaxID=392032 RepID=A0A820B1P7_9BILA|nr:unnamed protein product [Rotaria socialis]CAF4200486.1 unnamed protein product [Rotaria socialis]
MVKSAATDNNERPILTGMALGLNSTLLISEGNTKLPPCPMLLLSNSDGLLQVYYFICKSLPPICRTFEVIQQIQALQPTINMVSGTSTSTPPPPPSSSSSIPPTIPFSVSTTKTSSNNGFSFSNFGFTDSTFAPNNSQPNKQPPNNPLSSIQPSLPITNESSSTDDIFKSLSTNKVTPTSQIAPTKVATNNEQPPPTIVNTKTLRQMTNELQSKLKAVQNPLSKPSDSPIDLDRSLKTLITSLNTTTKSLETSLQSIKSMTGAHIESQTRIENARHQIILCQKENLYDLLKDRELDPWTQLRIDSVKTKYEKLKHDFNVLLQLTNKTIHDKSFINNDDDDVDENEDFLPDFEILDTTETMKQRMNKRLRDLSHKVTETEKDLANICKTLNTDLLSSKPNNSNFSKTKTSSSRSFHEFDSKIFSHLQATHQKVLQIHVPATPIIQLSSIGEPKQSSTTEIAKSQTPTIESSTLGTTKQQTPTTKSSTPIQPNSPSGESESFKNMLRLVRTSIDLFSGATSPEQLRELSSTIATSPLASGTVAAQKSNITGINRTPTMSKTANPAKSSTIAKPTSTNLLQTPGTMMNSSIPNISFTPATPTSQTISSDTQSKLQANRPSFQTTADQSKQQSASVTGDTYMRSLLGNSTMPSTTTSPSLINQLGAASTTTQGVRPALFPNASATASTPQVINQIALSAQQATGISTSSSSQPPFGNISSTTSTTITSVQSTSPTTKPIVSTSLNPYSGQAPFSISGFNLTSNSPSTSPFGTTTTTTTTTGSSFTGAVTTTSAPSIFGATVTATASPFDTTAPTTTATAITPTSGAGIFGAPTTSTASVFGTGFGSPSTMIATTSSAPTVSIFGTPISTSPGTSIFGAGTTATPGTNLFGGAPGAVSSPASPFGSGFGSALTTAAPSTSAFGGGFGNTTTTTGTSPFGSTFGATTPTSSASPFGSRFGATTTATSTTPTSVTSAFGGTGFSVTSPAASTLTTQSAAGGGSSFGSRPTFGSSFTGFATQSNAAASSTGFSFGGFGSAQPAEAQATQPGFGSFGAASTAASPFGGAVGQTSGFPSATSSFGAATAQPTASPSFTAYRK